MIENYDLPYFPCYIADWLDDTQDLTDEEDGSYFRLVRFQWKFGYVPSDMKKMRKISDSIDDTWPVIKRFFVKDENGNWYNQRTERERHKITSRIRAGSKGGRATQNKSSIKQSIKTPIKSSTKVSTSHTSDTIPQIPRVQTSEDEKPKRFSPPSKLEVLEFFVGKGSTKIEAEKFFYFYESKGWMVGKSKMKSWVSSASGWLARNRGETTSGKPVEVYDINKAIKEAK